MQTQMIHKGQHYTACTLDGDLIVTSNRLQRGKRLQGAAAAHWLEAIKTAMDKQEAHALCRAIYND